MSLDGVALIRPRLLIVLTDPQDEPDHLETVETAMKIVAVPNLAASVSI